MSIPPAFVIFRVVTVTVTILLLLAAGLGLGGHGPIHALIGLHNSALAWLRVKTGLHF